MTPAFYPSRSPLETAVWRVESHSSPGTFYEVRPDAGPGGSCSCPDFQHRGGPCKHIRQVRAEAAALSELLGGDWAVVEDDRPAPEPTPEERRAEQIRNAALYRQLFPEEA